jgi:hypothetical protein
MPTPLTICLRRLFTAAPALVLILGAEENTTRRLLKAPEQIQGYPCAAGYAWFFGDGRLSACRVSRVTAFGGITIPAGSQICLARDGNPRFVFLAHDAAVKGYRCRGGENAWSTALYPVGELKTCWLAEDSVVDGVPCMRAGFAADVFGGGVELDFHENGRLQTCKLSRDTTVDGRAVRKGDHVHLDAAGKLISSN